MNTKKIQSAWRFGLPWGAFMFVVMDLIPMIRNRDFDTLNLAIGFIIWMFFGSWLFGYLMQLTKSK
jgi:hypothetical protein